MASADEPHEGVPNHQATTESGLQLRPQMTLMPSAGSYAPFRRTAMNAEGRMPPAPILRQQPQLPAWDWNVELEREEMISRPSVRTSHRTWSWLTEHPSPGSYDPLPPSPYHLQSLQGQNRSSMSEHGHTPGVQPFPMINLGTSNNAMPILSDQPFAPQSFSTPRLGSADLGLPLTPFPQRVPLPPQELQLTTPPSLRMSSNFHNEQSPTQRPRSLAMQPRQRVSSMSTFRPQEDTADENDEEHVPEEIPRSRAEPRPSDPHPKLSPIASIPLAERTIIREMTKGMDSGRNMFALFGDDETARLRYSVWVDRGRSGKRDKKGEQKDTGDRRYPCSASTPLPYGVDLEGIASRYPNHVWGEGIRLFMAEGWCEERIWRAFPQNFTYRHGEITTKRPWNFLQQAYRREKDRMALEAGLPRREVESKKRGAIVNTAEIEQKATKRSRSQDSDVHQNEPELLPLSAFDDNVRAFGDNVRDSAEARWLEAETPEPDDSTAPPPPQQPEFFAQPVYQQGLIVQPAIGLQQARRTCFVLYSQYKQFVLEGLKLEHSFFAGRPLLEQERLAQTLVKVKFDEWENTLRGVYHVNDPSLHLLENGSMPLPKYIFCMKSVGVAMGDIHHGPFADEMDIVCLNDFAEVLRQWIEEAKQKLIQVRNERNQVQHTNYYGPVMPSIGTWYLPGGNQGMLDTQQSVANPYSAPNVMNQRAAYGGQQVFVQRTPGNRGPGMLNPGMNQMLRGENQNVEAAGHGAPLEFSSAGVKAEPEHHHVGDTEQGAGEAGGASLDDEASEREVDFRNL